MLRASLGKVVHTVKRAGNYAAKVPPEELHKIAVHVRAVVNTVFGSIFRDNLYPWYTQQYICLPRPEVVGWGFIDRDPLWQFGNSSFAKRGASAAQKKNRLDIPVLSSAEVRNNVYPSKPLLPGLAVVYNTCPQ